MTLGDKIRSMSDEQLAILFVGMLFDSQSETIKTLSPIFDKTKDFSLVTVPILDYLRQLENLRREV